MEENPQVGSVEIINENPSIDFSTASMATGTVSILMYFMIFLYPYVNLYVKNRKKPKIQFIDWTLSNALKNCDKLIEVVIIMNFVYFMMWFFGYRGILFNDDSRLAMPVSMWCFAVAVTIILWNGIEVRNKHALLAVTIMLSGQIFAIITTVIYGDVLSDSKDYNAIKDLTITGGVFGLLLIAIFAGFQSNIMKSHLLAFCEFSHISIIGVILCFFVYKLPPLPSLGVVQLPLFKSEIKS